ncbi:MAG: hypothetical protein WCH85_02430 [Methanomicrobiales archaeon]
MNRRIALLMGTLIMSVLLIAATGCITPGSVTEKNITPVVTEQSLTPVPVQSTEPAVTSTTAVPTIIATATITRSPTITVKKTPTPIPESALKARIQDAKNQLDQLKNSDLADTIILSLNEGNCEIKRSRELGYLIDVNSGEMSFVKGDYGSIALGLFRQKMTRGQTYIILHTHAKDWYTCRGNGMIGLNTFSLADLAVASNLTAQGYHVQKVIAVSDKDYEVYPKTPDDWKTMEEVYEGVDHLEKRMEIKFSTYDSSLNMTFYDVDNLMPLLARELNYTYTVNNVILT